MFVSDKKRLRSLAKMEAKGGKLNLGVQSPRLVIGARRYLKKTRVREGGRGNHIFFVRKGGRREEGGGREGGGVRYRIYTLVPASGESLQP